MFEFTINKWFDHYYFFLSLVVLIPLSLDKEKRHSYVSYQSAQKVSIGFLTEVKYLDSLSESCHKGSG